MSRNILKYWRSTDNYLYGGHTAYMFIANISRLLKIVSEYKIILGGNSQVRSSLIGDGYQISSNKNN